MKEDIFFLVTGKDGKIGFSIVPHGTVCRRVFNNDEEDYVILKSGEKAKIDREEHEYVRSGDIYNPIQGKVGENKTHKRALKRLSRLGYSDGPSEEEVKKYEKIITPKGEVKS